MALCEDPGVALEPEYDHGDCGGGGGDEEEAGGDDFGMDLLQRARLLCQAANEIALPMLQSVQQLQDKVAAKESTANTNKTSDNKKKKNKQPSRPSTREEDGDVRQPVSKSKPSSRQELRDASSRSKSSDRAKLVKPPALPLLGNSTKLPQLVNPKPPPKRAAPSEPPSSIPDTKRIPVVPGLTTVVKKTTTNKTKPRSKNNNTDEEHQEDDASCAVLPLPKINATDEWRKEREAETIRQAQERARARVLRNNAAGKLSETATSNQQLAESSHATAVDVHDSGERQRQVEANRRRAEERVRRRKAVELVEQQAHEDAKREQLVSERPPLEETLKRAEVFRQRTLQRLQAAKREAQLQDEQQKAILEKDKKEDDPAHTELDAEEVERQRKRMEKKRRRETAERMRRHQQVADDQQRKENEIFEKGLNEFKTKKKDLERVAKGLHPRRSPSDDTKLGVDGNHPKMDGDGHTTAEFESRSGAARAPVSVRDEAQGKDSEPAAPHHGVAESETLSIAIDTEAETESVAQLEPEHKPQSPPSSGSTTTTRKTTKKLPSWKQPCVPILPAECYSQKAMLASPSDSYAERFRTGRGSPTGALSSTVSSSMSSYVASTTPVVVSLQPSKLQQARALLASGGE